MTRFRPLDDLDVSDRTVLVRVDLNLPMQEGEVTDFTRVDRVLPTIRELIDRGARVVLLSHFGRPKGQVNPDMSLRPVAEAVANRLNRPMTFADDCIGDGAKAAVQSIGAGEVALLENLRFHPGEEANDDAFASALAALGDCYVNDAFSCSHRAHASTEALARKLPAAAGRNMEAELSALSAALENPQRPVAAVVGGAKISTKLDVLGHLIDRVDVLIVGGAMANTFLNAQGLDVGASLCEPDLADTARAIVAKANEAGCEILLPQDALVADALKAGIETATVSVDAVPTTKMILDVGPKTVSDLVTRLTSWHTILWNGPLGAFEFPPFDTGTVALAKAAAARTQAGDLISVAGGGDTVAALRHAGVAEDFTYVSTAGGAFLEWLEGKELPGVKALAIDQS